MNPSNTVLWYSAYRLARSSDIAREASTLETVKVAVGVPRLVRSSTHAGGTETVVFNREGSLFATLGGMDQTLKIWSVASKALILAIILPDPLERVTFVPEKPTVCAVGAVQAKWCYDAIEGGLLRTVPVEESCVVLACSPEGARMGVVTSADDVAPSFAFPSFQLYATDTHAKILTRELAKGMPCWWSRGASESLPFPTTPKTVALLEAETGRGGASSFCGRWKALERHFIIKSAALA